MKAAQLFFATAYASNYHMFNWFADSECRTAPDAIWSYQVSDPNKTDMLTDAWPYLMYIEAPLYPYKQCGSLSRTIAMDGLCCYSYFHPETQDGVHSFSTFDETDMPLENRVEAFPKTVDGATYCELTNFIGYDDFYMQNNGFCIETALKCHPDGVVSVYYDFPCLGEPVNYTLSNTDQDFFDDLAGPFTGKLVTLNGGTKSIGWIAFSPATELFPTYENPIEIWAATSYAILFATEVLLSVFFLFRLYQSFKVANILAVLSHAIWLVYLCILLAYLYTEYKQVRVLRDYLTANKFFFGIANLSTAIYTTYFITRIWHISKVQTFGLYASVFIIHIATFGNNYIYGSFYKEGNGLWDDAIYVWEANANGLWFIFLFIYDVMPVLIVLARATFTSNGTTFEKIKTGLAADPLTALMMFSQVGLLFGYFVIEYLRNATAVPGNDRAYLAFKAFSLLMLVMHTAVNTLALKRIVYKIKTSNLGNLSNSPSRSAGGSSSGTRSKGGKSAAGSSGKGPSTIGNQSENNE